jgi:hypothetical protein
MAKDENKKLRSQTLADDLDTYASLLDIADYKPANAAYEKPAITTIYNAMIAKQHAEAQAEAAFNSAHDDATAAEWAMHNAILGATDQVGAQFGTSSNEYQAMGRKKKSEYGRPARTLKPPAAG